MKICVRYDSLTGNTKMLAEVIEKKYRDSLTEHPEDADVVFLGSWTGAIRSSAIITARGKCPCR